MKKIIVLLLCLIVCLSGCGNEEPEQIPNQNTIVIEPQQPETAADYETTVYPVKTWVNSIGSPYAQIIVGVKNTGTANLYLSSGDIDLENPDGSLFSVVSYVSVFPEIIAPGETAYYYQEVLLDSVASSELKAIPHLDIDEAYIDMIRCPVTDVTISETSYGEIKVMGRVENTTGEDQSLLYVSAMLFDANGNPLGHVFNILEAAAGEKVGFECVSLSFPEGISAADVANYSVVAYPTQFQF